MHLTKTKEYSSIFYYYLCVNGIRTLDQLIFVAISWEGVIQDLFMEQGRSGICLRMAAHDFIMGLVSFLFARVVRDFTMVQVCFCFVFCFLFSFLQVTTTRAANESSRVELDLTQARLMKIRVESSRAREMLRAEKPSSNSARYYSS
jgi:hypothetical protein